MEKEINQNFNTNEDHDDIVSKETIPEDNASSDFEYVSIIPEEKDAKFIEIFSGQSAFKYFLSALVIFGICFISFIFIFQVLMTHIGVVGFSMTPTINASALGDKGNINTDSVYYMHTQSYDYKDIVIIKGGKTDSGDMIIKRVVATPGQKITFKKNKKNITSGETRIYYNVYVNDVLLEEDYILSQENYLRYMRLDSVNYQYYNALITELNINGEFSQTLGDEQYFVMGDNRNNSVDSRWFGPVEKDYILGKVVIQIKHGENLFTAIIHSIFNCRLPILPIKL